MSHVGEPRQLLELRDTARDLLIAEAATLDDTTHIQALRTKLATGYESYLARYADQPLHHPAHRPPRPRRATPHRPDEESLLAQILTAENTAILSAGWGQRSPGPLAGQPYGGSPPPGQYPGQAGGPPQDPSGGAGQANPRTPDSRPRTLIRPRGTRVGAAGRR